MLRGNFRPGSTELEWCDRRLLQRIHRLTVGRLRRRSSRSRRRTSCGSCSAGTTSSHRTRSAVRAGCSGRCRCSKGWEAPAAAWEQVLLPARVRGNVPELLERACWGGDVAWGRLTLREPRRRGSSPWRRGGPGLDARADLEAWSDRDVDLRPSLRARFAPRGRARRDAARAGPRTWLKASRAVAEVLARRGACFFAELRVGLEPAGRGGRGGALGPARSRACDGGRRGQPPSAAQPEAPAAAAGSQARWSRSMVAAPDRGVRKRGGAASPGLARLVPRPVGNRVPRPGRPRAARAALA